ncbi:MAG: M28 family peptidase [Thermodesulfovibrionales bacterium]
MGNKSSHIQNILSEVSKDSLKAYLFGIEGLRHAWENYDALRERAEFIGATLRSFHLSVENQEVPFYGRTYQNIIATMEDGDKEKDWILIGAHYDAAWGSPGADDNASGVAVLLEAARILSSQKLNSTVQFVAFTLEEPQLQTIKFLIGSEYFAKEARRLKRNYGAVLILESVGYTSEKEGSQIVPFLVRRSVPGKGNFLGVIANRRSKALMEEFYSVAGEYVPELSVIPYKVPLSGFIIPETRFSDHASFWNYRYPALMLTDTAMFRNPHYHTYHDSLATLDFEFIANVTKAVVSSVLIFSSGGHSRSGDSPSPSSTS